MALENVMLTLNEVAELEENSYESVRKNAQRGNLKVMKVYTGERKGFEYRMSLEDLSDRAKRKYYARLKATDETIDLMEVDGENEDKYVASIEELSDKQRQDIAFWKKLISDWRKYISHYPGKKTKMTKEFVKIHNLQNPDRKTSSRTLNQKWKDLRDYGDVALADHRASRRDKGRININEVVWSIFQQWWLDENQPTTSYVYRMTCNWARLKMPELLPLPSEDTFRRAIDRIPVPVVSYFREGEKKFEDECLPYLVRQYDYIDSNDIWSADYHTLDLMVRDDITGKVFRPHVIVWIDVRSRKYLSVRLCESSNSDGVVLAFRDAIKKYGIPKQVYLDNGREFLVHDFGGRGKRKTDKDVDYGSNILERLGIEMVNAMVRNARAKVIERTFKQVSEQFSKLYFTYCGNRPENRPNRHNKVLKDENNIPLLSEVKKELELYIEGIYNMEESKAEGLNGKSPNECYSANLIVKRTAREEELNLMLARSSRLQSVERNGVFLRFGEKKIYFYDEEFVESYFKTRVYVRYDSEDLSSVRIYDEEERLLGEMPIMVTGGYDQPKDVESIKKINSSIRKMKSSVKRYMKDNVDILEAPEMKEIVMAAARKNIENDRTSYEATIIQPLTFNNREVNAMAVGEASAIVDMDRMIKNARKNKREE